MKIIIVGASGYIGSKLLTEAKKISAALGTSSQGTESLLRLRLDFPDEFNYDVLEPSDVVLLTSAISSPDVCGSDFNHAWSVNVTGTSTFISKVIAKGARLIFFSSDTVYGERMDDFTEMTHCNPAGDYARMKHEIEKRFIGNQSFKTIRLSYVFSIEDKFTKYLLACADRGDQADIYHPFYRAIVHRNDVTQGVLELARLWDDFPQSIVNFGGPDVIDRMEYAQGLRDSVLPTLRYRQIDPGEGFFINRPRNIQMRSPLLESLLGRTPRSFSEAVQLEFNQ